MADVMVTGRMSQAKKAAGNKVLQSLGLNASQVINQLYDYLIAKNATPFDTTQTETIAKTDLTDALNFVRSVQRKNCFSQMTDEEIKRSKLAKYGITPRESENK